MATGSSGSTTSRQTSLPPEQRQPGSRRLVAVVLVLAAIALGAAVVAGVYGVVEAFRGDEASGVEVRSSANVVAAVRDLARLESAEYHMERVIDLRDRQSKLFGLIRTEDAILLVAAADVVAGVDLTEMEDGDIVVDEEARTATVTLPPPRVLHTRLDNAHTFVHRRSTDLLAERDENLEARARRRAESELERAAVEAGILARARRNAAETVRTLVGALGFEEVQVRWTDQE